MSEPWHDTPTCDDDDCGCPVTALEASPWLWCVGCGQSFEGTIAQWTRAKLADDAWEAHEAEQERDAPTLARMGPVVRSINQRLLARAPMASALLEQLDMFAGPS